MTQTRAQYVTDTITNHGTAETGGISNLNTGVATINSVNWSRATARAALGNGSITQAQFVQLMQAISAWEQEQQNLSFSKLQHDSPDPLPR